MLTSQEEHNRDVVLRAIKALSDHDVDGFFSYHTADMTSHEVFFPEPLTKDELEPFLYDWLHAYPDVKIETVNIKVEGDIVAVENIVSGTFENDLQGVKATGRFYKVREAVFFEMENGKIRNERIYIDQKSIEEQLGTWPQK